MNNIGVMNNISIPSLRPSFSSEILPRTAHAIFWWSRSILIQIGQLGDWLVLRLSAQMAKIQNQFNEADKRFQMFWPSLTSHILLNY
jgi:hypothetical protein